MACSLSQGHAGRSTATVRIRTRLLFLTGVAWDVVLAAAKDTSLAILIVVLDDLIDCVSPRLQSVRLVNKSTQRRSRRPSTEHV